MKPISNFFEEDVEGIPKKEKMLLLKNALINNNCNFMESTMFVDNNFHLQGLRLKIFEVAIKRNNDHYIKNKYKTTFIQNSKEDDILFLKKLYEFQYISVFQNFEVFIATSFKILYWYKPSLLGSVNSQKYLKYNGKNTIIEREKFLDREVKKVIMSGNITDNIKKLYELINMDINKDIAQDKLNNLYIISLNRNLSVHNLGIVNNLYIDFIKNNKMKCDFKKGDYIFEGKYDKNEIVTNETQNFLKQLTDKISDTLTIYVDSLSEC